jgi:L-ascorbate metabolism protein UlaG (beta-lactamase superfamily)
LRFADKPPVHIRITARSSVGPSIRLLLSHAMKITWYGHACFRLEGRDISVVTDPYTPSKAGLAPIREPADFVVMSSANDEAHSYPEMVSGTPVVVNALDALDAPVDLTDQVTVSAVSALEGGTRETRPDDPKANAMYSLTIDGVTVCHMGDIGTPLTAEQAGAFAGRTDVLLALAGANLTIALADLDDAIELIGAPVVIPMHYFTPSIRYGVGPVEDFLARRAGDEIVLCSGSDVEILPSELPARRTIMVLQPALDSKA